MFECGSVSASATDWPFVIDLATVSAFDSAIGSAFDSLCVFDSESAFRWVSATATESAFGFPSGTD